MTLSQDILLCTQDYSIDQEDLIHLQQVGAINFSESIGSIASTRTASTRTTRTAQSTRDKLADALKKQEEAEQRQAEAEARLRILEALIQARKTTTTTTTTPNPDEATNREGVESSSVTLSKEQREEMNHEEVGSSSAALSKEKREDINQEEVEPSSVTLSKEEEEMNHKEVGSVTEEEDMNQEEVASKSQEEVVSPSASSSSSKHDVWLDAAPSLDEKGSASLHHIWNDDSNWMCSVWSKIEGLYNDVQSSTSSQDDIDHPEGPASSSQNEKNDDDDDDDLSDDIVARNLIRLGIPRNKLEETMDMIAFPEKHIKFDSRYYFEDPFTTMKISTTTDEAPSFDEAADAATNNDRAVVVQDYDNTISNLAKRLGISKTQFEKIINTLASFPGKQNFNFGDDFNPSSFSSDIAATTATVRDGNMVSSKVPSTKNQVKSGAHRGVVSDYKPDLLDYIFEGTDRTICSSIHKINDTNDDTKLDHMLEYLFEGGICGATADRFACGPMQDSSDEFDGYNSQVCSSMHFMEGEEEDGEHHLCQYTSFPCSTNNNLQQQGDDDQEHSLEDFDEVLKQATLSSSSDKEESDLHESPSTVSTQIKTGGYSTKMVLLQYNSSSEEDEEVSPIPSPEKLTIVGPDDLTRMNEDEDGDGDDANIEGLRKSLREADFQFRAFLGGILDNVAKYMDTSIEVEGSPKSGEPEGDDSDDDGDISWYMKTYANDPEKLKMLLDAKKLKDEARNPSVEKKSKNKKDSLKALLTNINPDLEKTLKKPFACIDPDFENASFDNDDDDRQAEASLSGSNGGEGGASVEDSINRDASVEDSINTHEDVPTTFCGCYKPSLRHEATKKKDGKKKLSLMRESRSEKPGVPTKFLQQNRSAFLKKTKRRRRRQSQRKPKPKKLLLSYE